MKKNLPPQSPIFVICSAVGSEGEGIARSAEGKALFIKGLLPGERAEVLPFKRTKSYDVCRLLRIVEPSPDRVAPPCPLFSRCGGCQMQHMTHTAEIGFKRRRVEDAFHRIAGLAVTVANPVTDGLEYRYRNKLSMPVRPGRDGIDIGFYAARSHTVVDVQDCLLQPEWNRTLISLFRRFLTQHKLTAYDEQTGSGTVRHLIAREEADGHLTVSVVIFDGAAERFRPFFKVLTTAFESVSLFVNRNTRRDNVILGEGWEKLDEVRTNAPPAVPPHPAAFYQVNRTVADMLYAAAADAVQGGTVVDAYSGGGILTARLAERAGEVYGIEIDPAAHRDAELRKTRLGISNMHPILGDCAVELPKLLPRIQDETLTVVLDPPRRGADASVIEAVKAASPIRIVYISCDPATLARDAARLSDTYTVTSVTPYDMFPRTANVETLCILARTTV